MASGRIFLKLNDFEDIPRSTREHLIDEWILSERNRKILKRKLIDKITYENLAEEVDMSVRQIQYIVDSDLENISRHI